MFYNISKVHFLILLVQFMCGENFHYIKDNDCEAEVDTPTVEFYKKDDSLFILFSERVSWFEASLICQTYEALLCIPNSTVKANFIVHFLAETNFKLYDFWIGAKRINGQWMWVDGQPMTELNITLSWPWDKISWGKDCLAVERHNHTTPIFVELYCYLPKPFICERALTSRTVKPLPSLPTQSVKINESVFTFYHSRIAWNDALTFCRTIGQRLAIIPNKAVLTILRAAMLRSRPQTENVWIGGYYEDKFWVWVSTGEVIPNKSDEDNFPPWYNRTLVRSKKYDQACILFDRHFADVYFVPERCQRRRDFLCEKQGYTPNPTPIKNDTTVCIHGSIIMYIFLIDSNWTEAQQFCFANDTFLAEPMDNATLKAIAVCLGDQPGEPRHVWLGGKHKKDKWMWMNSNKEVSKSFPWCEDKFEEDSQCLNMDRTDHDVPWIYGLQCRTRQPFVCEVGPILTTTTEEPTTTTITMKTTITTTEVTSTTKPCNCPCEQPAIPMFYKNRTFIAYIFLVESDENFYYCKRFGGVPFPAEIAQHYRDYVLDYIKQKIDLCGCCTYDMINFWITKHLNKCTSINLGSGKVSKPSDCQKEQAFICETFCEHPPNLEANENATITCSWLKGAGGILYNRCKFGCGYGYTIFGPDRMNCMGSSGWYVYKADDSLSPALFPECSKTENTAHDLVQVLAKLKPEGFYFIVRETQTETLLRNSKQWSSLMQFVLNIIQVYPLSNELPLGMFSFSNKAKIRIPYNAIDSCDVLKKVRGMKRANHVTEAFYDLALNTVQEEIAKYQPKRKTIIFFLIDRENTHDDYEDVVMKLQEKHTVFVVGVTNNKFIFDLDMVASIGRTYRLHTIKIMDYPALANMSLKLTEFRSPKINCAKDLYIMPDLNTGSDDQNTLPTDTLDVIQQKEAYSIINIFVAHKKARSVCKHRYGGNLIENRNSEKLVKEKNIKQFHIEKFWVQNYLLADDVCQAMDVYSKQLTHYDCLEKLPFICVADCSIIPPKINDDNENEDEPHRFGCYENEVLWGPGTLQCNSSNGGWTAGLKRASPFPTCISIKPTMWVKTMYTILNTNRNRYKAGILFVLDESDSVTKAQFQIQIKFVEAVVKLYPASKILPYGVITFKNNAAVKIAYDADDSCAILKKLHSIKFASDGSPDFAKALRMVNGQIAKFRPNQLTEVFFVTYGEFMEDLLPVKTAKDSTLKYNVEIYVFKIGEFDSEVASELATRNSEYNLNVFNINSYDDFDVMVALFLKDTKKPRLKC